MRVTYSAQVSPANRYSAASMFPLFLSQDTKAKRARQEPRLGLPTFLAFISYILVCGVNARKKHSSVAVM